MFEEEHIDHSQPEIGLETVQRWFWVAVGVIAALGGGGNATLARGILCSVGLLGPLLFFAYRQSPDRPLGVRLGVRYLLWMLPWWGLLAVALAGAVNPAYSAQTEGGAQVWTLADLGPNWQPLSGPFETTLIDLFLVTGLYAVAVNALMVTHGRLVFARTWAMLSWFAGALALLGLAQKYTSQGVMLWSISTNNPRFFATFPHAAQWCAFAILWLGASLGVAGWLLRQRGWKLMGMDGWMLLGAAAALGVSVAVTGDPLHQILVAAVAAVGCLSLAWQTWHGPRRSHTTLAGCLCVLASFACGAAAMLAAQAHGDAWINYALGQTGHDRMIETALNLWRQRPWFGWGRGTFGVIYSLFQQADQNTTYVGYARSDLVQGLLENGVIGLAIWFLPGVAVFLRLLWARRLATFLVAPLAALAAVGGLAVVDFPFSSPAVFFAFWLLLFGIMRWSALDDETHRTARHARRDRE